MTAEKARAVVEKAFEVAANGKNVGHTAKRAEGKAIGEAIKHDRSSEDGSRPP
jgi:hypothetical protein